MVQLWNEDATEYFQTHNNFFWQIRPHCDILLQWYKMLSLFVISFRITHTLNQAATIIHHYFFRCAFRCLMTAELIHTLKHRSHILHYILWCSPNWRWVQIKRWIELQRPPVIMNVDCFTVFMNWPAVSCTCSHMKWKKCIFFQQRFSFSSTLKHTIFS